MSTIYYLEHCFDTKSSHDLAQLTQTVRDYCNLHDVMTIKQHHITVMYSKVSFSISNENTALHKASVMPIGFDIFMPIGFDIFEYPDKSDVISCIVLLWDGVYQKQRHEELMFKFKCTHDFEQYNSHTTLFKIKNLNDKSALLEQLNQLFEQMQLSKKQYGFAYNRAKVFK